VVKRSLSNSVCTLNSCRRNQLFPTGCAPYAKDEYKKTPAHRLVLDTLPFAWPSRIAG